MHPVYSMLYAANLGLCDYVLFSQIRSRIIPQLRISIIIWEWSIHYASLSAVLKPLHSKVNQELYEKHLFNQSSYNEKYEWGHALQLQVPHPSIIVWKVKHPLHFFVNYFQLITQQDESGPSQTAPL